MVPMSPASASTACHRRLADQLQSLTEVAETLTLRLLELEDRLAAQEREMQPLLSSPDDRADQDDLDETEVRLAETEDRLERLEALLNAQPSGDGPRHLHALDSPSGLRGDAGSDREEGFDPFPAEDIDPPFLDDLGDAPLLASEHTVFESPFELELRQA